MKAIVLEELSIGYVDIPKVASTSIMLALYELSQEKKFDRNKEGIHLHEFFTREKKDISLAKFKFTVLRDPVKRFLSGYSNRVTHHKELSYEYLEKHHHPSAKKLLEKNPILNPGLGQFLEFFGDYYQTPSIHHHLRPVTEIIEGNLDIFDKIYTIENIKSLEEDISKISKKDFVLPRSQTGGKKFSVKDLNSSQIDFLIDFYKGDYKMMNDFYSIDDVWKAWKSDK